MSYKQFAGEIQWHGGFSADMLMRAPDIGSLVVRAESPDSFRMLVYRAVPSSDSSDTMSNLYATVGWNNLPADRRSFRPHAKGTGLYTGLTPRSVAVFADSANGRIGAYLTPEVTRSKLLDRRDGDPGFVTEARVLMRSTARYLASKISSEHVVRHVDNSYGSARAVLLTPAPTVMAKERARRGPLSEAPGWLLWRDPSAGLIRVGTIAA